MPLPLLAKSRVFDYFEKRGLEKITDVNAGDWHLYIVKELVDNALDADEAAGLRSQIRVEFKYRPPGHLAVAVSNTALFPLDQVEEIFSFDAYTSVKDYFNSLTRGQQGNGLKTILGMPYALRHFTQGRYAIGYVPLTIQAGDRKCHVACKVDEERQTAQVQVSHRRPQHAIRGTRINVNVANFAPHPPPSIDELGGLARKYALWNPFASFYWELSFTDETRDVLEFPSRSECHPIAAPPPVRWYRFDQFARLCRRLIQDDGVEFADLFARFMHLDAPDRRKRLRAALSGRGIHTISDLHEEANLRAAYDIVLEGTPQISLDWLGEVGARAVDEFARTHLDSEGYVCYRSHKETPLPDPCAPFVLEVFMLRSRQVRERTLWVGVNFSPLYKDPFYRKRFRSAGGGETEVVGLNPVLQSLGIESDDNVLVGVHLISPNIDFQSFGKAEFDCRLIEAPLLDILEDVAQDFCRRNRIKSNERLLLPLIGKAAEIVSSQGRFRFTLSQLHRRTHGLARQEHPEIPAEPRSDDLERFRSILIPEHEQTHGPIEGLIRSRKTKFLHPSKPFGTVLWIMKEGFEDVFISNDLMNVLELAIFWGEVEGAEMWPELAGHLHKNKSYTVLALHDAEVGAMLDACQAAKASEKERPPNCRFVDLGLFPTQALELGITAEPAVGPALDDPQEEALLRKSLSPEDAGLLLQRRCRFDLNALSTDELVQWIVGRYIEIGVVEDRPLDRDQMRDHVARYLLRLARARIEQRVSDELGVAAAVERITQSLSQDLIRHDAALLDKLVTSPPRAWKDTIDAFAEDFLNSHLNRTDIRKYARG